MYETPAPGPVGQSGDVDRDGELVDELTREVRLRRLVAATSPSGTLGPVEHAQRIAADVERRLGASRNLRRAS